MSDTYTKLFSSITESTVWGESYSTRIVWVTMLAMADASGNVYGAVPGLARRANVTLAEVESALAAFLSPDPYSRTKDDDGRRIAEIAGGWNLVTHAKYSTIRNAEERREYKRDWDRDNRPSGHARSPKVRQKSDKSPPESDSPAPPTPTPTPDTTTARSKTRGAIAPELPDWLPGNVWQDWHDYRNSRKGWTHKARSLSLRTLTELWAQGHNPREVIDQAIERGWTGLFPVRSHDPARAGPAGQAQSKTLSAIQRLEGMKNGLVDPRTDDRFPKVALLGTGSDPRY